MSNTLFLQADIADARARFSELMTGVVLGHRPVQVNRHGGREQMFLLAREELTGLLELTGERFETRVIVDDRESRSVCPHSASSERARRSTKQSTTP